LFGDLKLPIIRETEKGNASTDEGVMKHLAKQHPAPLKLLEYRLWTKRLNTYFDPWIYYADHLSRIHPTYKPHGTVTGRLSSVEPNLQQVPRDSVMRTVFGAAPGWVFMEADYSQVELRVAAMLAGESRMLRAFYTGVDIHLQTATEVSGIPIDQIDKETRKKAKSYNFAIIYDVGPETLKDYAFEKFDVTISLQEAEDAIRKWFKLYPRFRPWHDRQRRLAERYERVYSPIGRVRHLPDVRSRNYSVRNEAFRQAINSPVQSFASDLMLLSLVQLTASFNPTRARIVGTVHDSILFEVREGHVEAAMAEVKETMEGIGTVVKRKFGYEIDVPLEADIKVSTHWGL
jgi:DNA polymerase I-like protein with 3'-5' exonuclease and polymerase domains